MPGRIAVFPRGKVSNCLGDTAYFPRRKVASSLGRTASFTGGKVSKCLGRNASFPRGKESTCLPAYLRLIASLPRGREVLACLPAWEAKLLELVGVVALALVIFPSFLFSKILYLFNCRCLSLVNLISPTLSMKPWHSLSLCAEIIEASCDLHSSVCLETLSRIPLIAFILV